MNIMRPALHRERVTARRKIHPTHPHWCQGNWSYTKIGPYFPRARIYYRATDARRVACRRRAATRSLTAQARVRDKEEQRKKKKKERKEDKTAVSDTRKNSVADFDPARRLIARCNERVRRLDRYRPSVTNCL